MKLGSYEVKLEKRVALRGWEATLISTFAIVFALVVFSFDLAHAVERISAQPRVHPKLHPVYDIVHADGSKHTVAVVGEAMDSGDKATNKAMSAAYKYMALQVFCIPTEGDNDADKQTHEVAAPPEIPADVRISLEVAASEGLDALKATWKGLSADSRELVTKNHGKCWSELKANAQSGA